MRRGLSIVFLGKLAPAVAVVESDRLELAGWNGMCTADEAATVDGQQG